MPDNRLSIAQRRRFSSRRSPTSRNTRIKFIVIKYGGNAMINEEFKKPSWATSCCCRSSGSRSCLCTAAGRKFRICSKKSAKKSEFVNGLRVTDAETVDIVQMVLAGKINKSLAVLSAASAAGPSPVRLDCQMIEAENARRIARLCWRITSVNTAPILDLLKKGTSPSSPPSLRQEGQRVQYQRGHGCGRHRGLA